MLSLLPPLKTREISPRFNFTVGKGVKEQQTSMANLKGLQDNPGQVGQGTGKKGATGRKAGGKSKGRGGKDKAKIIHVPNTKIIISQSGDSPLMRNYADSMNPAMIHNHPVMIKAVASNKSLEKNNGHIITDANE